MSNRAPLRMNPRPAPRSALCRGPDPSLHGDTPTPPQASNGQDQSCRLPPSSCVRLALSSRAALPPKCAWAPGPFGLPPAPSAPFSPAWQQEVPPALALCLLPDSRRTLPARIFTTFWVLSSKLCSRNYLPRAIPGPVTHRLANIWRLSAALRIKFEIQSLTFRVHNWVHAKHVRCALTSTTPPDSAPCSRESCRGASQAQTLWTCPSFTGHTRSCLLQKAFPASPGLQ